MYIPTAIIVTVLLGLIVFGRSYSHRLTIPDPLFVIQLWPLVGIVLVVVSQYLLYNTHDQLLTVMVNGVALFGAYIEICRRR